MSTHETRRRLHLVISCGINTLGLAQWLPASDPNSACRAGVPYSRPRLPGWLHHTSAVAQTSLIWTLLLDFSFSISYSDYGRTMSSSYIELDLSFSNME